MTTLDDLMSAVVENNKANAGQITALAAELEKLTLQQAAFGVMGSGGGSPNKARRKKALAALGQFAARGDFSAMAEIIKASGMATDSDPDGGYVVAPEIDQAIIKYQLAVSPMRRLATVMPVRGMEFKFPVNTDLPDSGWVGEREDRPQTTGAVFGAIGIQTNEEYANPAISQSLLDDSFVDIGGFVANTIGTAFTKLEGSAWVSGDGVKKPRGILTYNPTSADDASRSFGVPQYIPTGDASGFAASNPGDALVTTVFKLASPYRALGATWTMNSSTAAVISKWKDQYGRYLWTQSLQTGMPSQLCGFNVELDESMPDIGANAYPVAFGCWKLAYFITDRIGTRILRDPYTAKPYVLFYTTKRVGGGVIDAKAYKLVKCAAA